MLSQTDDTEDEKEAKSYSKELQDDLKAAGAIITQRTVIICTTIISIPFLHRTKKKIRLQV